MLENIQFENLRLIKGGKNIYPILCENMRRIIKNKKITQRRMSIDMRIDQSTLSKYESCTRNPDLNYILEFCKKCNVSLDSLINSERKEY